jgi:hypothetical protein
MFIQFYKVGELFDEAQSLEDRFLIGLLDLKSKVIAAFLTKQTTEHQRSLLQAICKALNNFFEAGNYSKTIEVGTPLIELINSFSDAKIKLHLIIGMAKYHLGQYSDGMDHIEFALQSIPSPAVDDDYEKERATACWYLVHRLKYLDTCYRITWNLGIVVVGIPSVVTVVVVGIGMYVILTPFPFNIYEKSIHNKGEKPVLSHHPSTALATRTVGLELFNSYSKWFIVIQPQLKAVLSGTRTTLRFIKELRLSLMKFRNSLPYFTLCVLWVWVKLIYAYVYIAYIKVRWFRHPAKSRQAMYYFSHYYFYLFAVLLLILLTFKHYKDIDDIVIYVKETLRKIRDPRFRYGVDGTPHSRFIDSI